MDTIVFHVHPDEELPGARRVVPVVDGVPLTASVTDFEVEHGCDDPAGGYDGIAVDAARAAEHARDLTTTSWWRRSRRVDLLGCECGGTACWPLEARVHVGEHAVTWDRFRQPHRPSRDYSGFGPFAFDAASYREAVRALEG
ncbi:hypothetical protein [Geodermatophilus sp. DSM 45219]|uniref:hypothetical protein n=1 Tax=Geodermatophilus sp. DSM 45219 TaxID=1881103 RepID=UPI00088E94BB|nr:hypothetical protein [Geodermatophilus sp. DSM 45219]SDO31293.1 hypothetical protein SAMN05428965_3478 [Geodermatophilus sp. DSM 45219]